MWAIPKIVRRVSLMPKLSACVFSHIVDTVVPTLSTRLSLMWAKPRGTQSANNITTIPKRKATVINPIFTIQEQWINCPNIMLCEATGKTQSKCHEPRFQTDRMWVDILCRCRRRCVHSKAEEIFIWRENHLGHLMELEQTMIMPNS